ncbi:MAG: methylenetetrahydrofolate reductase [NAD(P)H] [Syntrophales bacterium]|jgi:methylenetetrahydrofolate reductase (NADPH)|nr:methylenetetrahydrofolate reductase [NAD(P)H] [Syntrophales bacterium]
MKIKDIYRANNRLLSFEVFPPVRDGTIDRLFAVIERLSELNPDFISVTYGAGGTTRDMSVDIASAVKKRGTAEVMAHLTCVGATRQEIENVLGELTRGNIKNILALRGDPPAGQTSFTKKKGGFAYANELVEFIGRFNFFCIGVAGYPEGHMEAPSFKADIENLKRKIDAGADFVITQLFYNNDDFYRFRDAAIRAGINVPLIPGIFPIFNYRQIQKIASLCGAKIPSALHEALYNSKDENERVEEYGIEYALRQSNDLLQNNVPGLHFYSMNRSRHVERIVRNLSWERG